MVKYFKYIINIIIIFIRKISGDMIRASLQQKKGEEVYAKFS